MIMGSLITICVTTLFVVVASAKGATQDSINEEVYASSNGKPRKQSASPVWKFRELQAFLEYSFCILN